METAVTSLSNSMEASSISPPPLAPHSKLTKKEEEDDIMAQLTCTETMDDIVPTGDVPSCSPIPKERTFNDSPDVPLSFPFLIYAT